MLFLHKSYVKIMNNLWDFFFTDTWEFFQVFEKAYNSFYFNFQHKHFK